ncbi:hypothetical protein EV646_12046 [Kribbella antiqua]|uniref:Uncharacterized protein n=1 Tax=Kribbella antiqua TaxID=2512217 RepID=A0A4R2I3F9_9ACTN|nr:hypothetical protein [Kribbella antiqua]TCO38671.1 hypothetical protein EV646_12046 [Kribbella antiqua]
MPARLVATVLAAGFAVLAFLPALPARAATPELPDRIAAAWQSDKIYVDARLRSPGELDRIRTAARGVDFPVYVALVPQTPYTRENISELPTLLHARVGRPGLYVVQVVSDAYWSGQAELFRPAGLKGRTLTSVQLDDKQDLDIVDDQPVPQVVRTIQQAATAYDGRPLPAIPAGDLEPDSSEHGMSVTDREDLSAYIGLGIGALAGFALTLARGLRRRSRRAKSEPDDEPPVDEWARHSEADEWIERAEQALAKLDTRSGKSARQLDQRDDAYRRLDAARTLRADQPEDLLALTGALVLARQAARVAGGGPVQPPCFFDPAHGPGTIQVDWSDDVEVPACRRCAQLVRSGRTPSGLQVWTKSGVLGLNREQVPYWTLDPDDNPMVATGFGALSDELPDRIAGRKDEVR